MLKYSAPPPPPPILKLVCPNSGCEMFNIEFTNNFKFCHKCGSELKYKKFIINKKYRLSQFGQPILLPIW